MDPFGTVTLYNNTYHGLEIFFQWFPVWGTILSASLFWYFWMHYVQGQFLGKMKWVLLEVKLPREINKTPLAMEIALNALYQTSEGTWYDKIWKGKLKDYFSLEMVSIEGNVKFFIRTIERFRNIIEAQLYAQYPDIEILPVPDYVRYVDYTGPKGDWSVIGAEFKLEKPDAYPIKTYGDYGMDKEGVKEEFKIDPLTSIIEYLGSVGKGEQIWMQILVRSASKNSYHYVDPKTHKHMAGDWKKEGEHLVDEITKRKEKRDAEGGGPRGMGMTDGEKEVVKAVERNMGKLGFDCGIRALYLAKKDKFNFDVHSKAIGGILRPFTTNNLNGFGVHYQTFGFDYWWEDFMDLRINLRRREQFDAYKKRSWFYFPHKEPYHFHPFVLTTEELATIFHFPGGVAQTPTFGRIGSKKSEAPADLPI